MNQTNRYSQNIKSNLPTYNEIIRNRGDSSERVKVYQQLSHSINDIFADLLTQLDKQKNKEYLNNSDNNSPKMNLKSQQESTLSSSTSFINNRNLKQKDSNKDSGFNQDLVNKQPFFNNKTNSLTDENRNEVSLLERYLNNEQLIAFKHFQLVNLFTKYYKSKSNNSSPFIDDYGMIEYILSQEGISKRTFKKLIKEKFKNFEWSNELLSNTFDIINQPNDVLINCNNSLNMNGGDEDDVLDEDSDQTKKYNFESNLDDEESTDTSNSNQEQLKSEDKISNILVKTIAKHESIDSPNSPTSSSKSYRKLKDIKNSTNKKKFNVIFDQRQQQPFSSRESGEDFTDPYSNNEEIEEALKKNLSNSFTRRRERKGSLPEINTSHLVAFETNQSDFHNSSYISIGNNYSGLLRHKSGIDLTDTSILSKQTTDRRSSRRSAFVLEIMRTSMFRSKSLTDLNCSLVKIDKNNSSKFLNKFDGGGSIHSETNPNISKLDRSESFLNASNFSGLNVSQNFSKESYFGLIWQCADMNYEEFRNKYEELSWLMNGDKLSVSTKLKEVEQRLKIEINLREKNQSLLEKLNSENLMNNKVNVEHRLESQLKIINDKIKELEMMRLFLRICEINSHGLDNHQLIHFFNDVLPSNNNLKQNDHNLLQGKSYDEILKSLYGWLN